MGAGNRLEPFDSIELARERAVVCETAAVDDFDGAVLAENIAGKPDLPIAARTNPPDQFVIGNPSKKNDRTPSAVRRACFPAESRSYNQHCIHIGERKARAKKSGELPNFR